MPSRGIRKRLVHMAEENAEEVMKTRSDATVPGVAEEIAAVLGMEKAPQAIGAFDISNIAGKSAVGGFVCWENGAFNKSRYRHVRMDAIQGPDDYAMMKEMIRRTVESIRKREQGVGTVGEGEKNPLPDLVIIDGGREHLRAAQEVLGDLNVSGVLAAGLAKDPDRIFLEGREQPIPLDDNRASFLLLRKIRDEAHRFAIHYHRKLRAKKTFDSVLDSIYGLGRKRRFALLEHFGSIEAIKGTSVDELAALKGFNEKLAREILAALHTKKSKTENSA
jgi:excinuclease ABC subunit C